MSRSRFLRRLVVATAALSAGVGAVIPASTPASDLVDSDVDVILAATSAAVARAAVEEVGGLVTHELPLVDAVAATLPAAAVRLVHELPGVLAVVPDEKVQVQGGFRSAPAAAAPTGELPASVYREAVRSTELEADNPAATGFGVTVALLDTGITPSPDLGDRVLPVKGSPDGALAPCINLSGTPTCDDDYGHGTFMAGIIAGDGAASGGVYAGVAPQAKLVSIKVGGADGSADVSNVLAGIQWAVSFKKKYGIKVLNLSLGTDSTHLWRFDPLNWAVEQAWKAGITVVVAASNRGPDARTISKPGDDPYVITVGAVDDQQTAAIDDDVVPDFSSRGPAPDLLGEISKPDVVAPGAHLVSIRATDSAIDNAVPDPGNPYLAGSGTSMATAVVSGVAAQILSVNGTFTPNRVKFVLKKTARPVAAGSKSVVGAGIIDARRAGIAPPSGQANKGLVDPVWVPGGLDAARGSVDVQLVGPGTLLTGELTAQGELFVDASFLQVWNPTTWAASQWLGHPWYATAWAVGDNWEGDNWEGCWVGGDAGDDCAYGAPVSGSEWYGAWD